MFKLLSHLSCGAVLCLALVACVGCVDSPDSSSSSSETSTQKQTLQSTSQPEYTPLSQSEWERATRRIWEEPGKEHLKPPQHVLEAQTGPLPADLRPGPEIIQKQQEFQQAWQAEEQRLRNEGRSQADIAKARISFKGRFFQDAAPR